LRQETLILAREMTFSAEQYAEIAAGYREAAADRSIPSEKREEFARKAEWFRFLSKRLERKAGVTLSGGEERLEIGFSPEALPKRSLRPIRTILWVTGSAIYLVGMVWATNNVVNLFRQELEKKPISVTTRPVFSPRVLASNQETGRGQPAVPTSSPDPHREHAISPAEPRHEAPGLIVPPAMPDQGEITSGTSPTPTDEASVPAPETSASAIQVTGTAATRIGTPSDSKVIGTAAVTPASPQDEGIVAETRVNKAASATRQKLVMKKVRKKPREPAEVAKQRRSRPSPPARDRAYADLPGDEEFLAETPPRRGVIGRRRMLREGLMSPGFLPPR
jgi:hypothetical protein